MVCSGINTSTLLAKYFMSELHDYYDCAFEDHILTERKFRLERRDKMIACLAEVAAEATAALMDAGLSMPLFFSVPSSGEALATFGMPGNPCEKDRHRACDIIARIVGRKLGIEGLWANAVPCAASVGHMGAADIRPASDDHDRAGCRMPSTD
jgi:hypothetical protein